MPSSLPLHFFSYSGLLGVTLYQSLYSGIVSYRALPIEMFSKLQHRIFPGYFAIQSSLTAILLLTRPFRLTRVGSVSLATIALSALVNLAIIMPIAHKLVSKRDAQMELEGKSYKDPTASDQMKALNKSFAKVHGISMLFNLALIISTISYGLYFVSKLTVVPQL